MESLQQPVWATMELFGNRLIDVEGVLDLLVRFIINAVIVCGIVRYFYYPKSRRQDYLFTFILISTAIFMLVFLMEGAKMKIGAALGLFAIFGIIRYRTETVPIREMTYLFFVVAISVINAMAGKVSLAELALANILVVLLTWALERSKLMERPQCKYVKYDNIDLITPEKRGELIADLKKRTGLDIICVEVGSIDFLKDATLLKIYYRADEVNTVNEVSKLPKSV
jgi:hypothetical protein